MKNSCFSGAGISTGAGIEHRTFMVRSRRATAEPLWLCCRVVTEFHIPLQVFKIFQFLFRYLPLKLNKKENETWQIKIEWKTEKIIFTYWIFFWVEKIYFCNIGNFLTKIFSVMFRNLYPVISVFGMGCVNESLKKKCSYQNY